MALLNSEAMAELSVRLESEAEEASVEKEAVVETETRVESEAKTEEKDEKKESQDSSTHEGETDSGHAVPYKRFKGVIDTKNELQSKNSKLEQQLSELRAQMENQTATPKEERVRDEFDDIFSDFDEQDAPADDRYSSLESRLRTFEEKQAVHDLEAELQSVTTQFPSVPESVLLQAVVNDPDANMVQVAKMYSNWVGEVEEKAIARHVANHKDVTTNAAPRRPSATGASGPSTLSKPRTMSEARDAALAFWKRENNLK